MIELEKDLWSISREPNDIADQEIREVYSKVYPYVKGFLCANHPYRKGAVCPFVPAAIKNDNIYFYYLSEQNVDTVVFLIEKIVKLYDIYRKKNKRNYISIVVMFPEDYSIKKLSDIHYLSKIFCIDNYIMIGATFKDNNAPSLHSDEFFPLRTLTPCLILRDLTVHDLLFLDPEHYAIDKRIRFLSKFIERFEDGMKAKENDEVLKAKDLLNEYRQELKNAQ